MPPVSCNDEGGADFQWTLRRLSAYADDSPFLEQRFLHVSSWEQMKRGISASLLDQEVEKGPLRHERDEPATRRKMPEVDGRDGFVAEAKGELLYSLVWDFQKRIENSKLAHEFERRRVNGVTAKVAEEVGVLFEHRDIDARSREKQTEHNARGATARDAAAGAKRVDIWLGCVLHRSSFRPPPSR
jgi:hypothetical protein